MLLPEPPTGFAALIGEITGWLGSQPLALKLLDKMGKSTLAKVKEKSL
jgi:hypothetical protein